jgi:hypothetical protein
MDNNQIYADCAERQCAAVIPLRTRRELGGFLSLGREDCECVLVPSGAFVRLVLVLFACDSVRG